jgi:hypothetical protein
MANELLQLRGRQAVNNDLIKALESGIDVDIDEARCLLDKFAPKAELNPARIKVVSDRLIESLQKLSDLQKQNAAIKRELGE